MLRGAALRVTRPRVAVLTAVHANPHADTDSIIRAVRADLPDVSHQAVYDSLSTLTATGLVRRIQPSGSVARYESRVGDNHHHVVCRSCGVIADVDCAVGEAPCLIPSADNGFVLDEAEVIYWGLCPDCSHSTDFPITPVITARIHPLPKEGPTCLKSENPAIPSPEPKAHQPLTNRDWWPNQVDISVLHAKRQPVQPDGRGLQLRRGIQEARRRGAQARHLRGDDDFAGLVAGRLRALRRTLHPDELACRGHVPHRTMAGAAAAKAHSASPPSTAGPTTRASTRRAGCCGRSSRSTARKSRGPT